ncbi:MAG: FecR domain-containing protein [Gemmatimonadaceae bacterium]
MTEPTPLDWEAIARTFTGEATPEEAARVQASLSQQPREEQAVNSLRQNIGRFASEIPGDLDIEAALASVKARPGFRDAEVVSLESRRQTAAAATSPLTRWRFLPMPALAAAALLAVGVASWMAFQNRPRELAVTEAPRMLATGVGVSDSMVLADGTRIMLGPLSSVRIAAGYAKTSRQVEITGDAWFSVVHDESIPFTVRAGTATIVDVGTVFSVQSDNSQGVAVSVSEGAVSLRQATSPPDRGVVLKAGDTGLLQFDGRVLAHPNSSTDDDVAWLRGRLVFRDAPIADVATAIRKWYGIKLIVADSTLSRVHLTATFAGESADRVLDVIGLTLGAEIDRHGDTAVVRSQKRSTRLR